MITVAFPDGTMEEYDLKNESDTRAYEYKISNRVRLQEGRTDRHQGGRPMLQGERWSSFIPTYLKGRWSSQATAPSEAIKLWNDTHPKEGYQ